MIESFWFLLIHMGKFVAPPLPKPTDVNWQFNPSSWKDDVTRVSPQHAVEVAKWPKNKAAGNMWILKLMTRVTPWGFFDKSTVEYLTIWILNLN